MCVRESNLVDGRYVTEGDKSRDMKTLKNMENVTHYCYTSKSFFLLDKSGYHVALQSGHLFSRLVVNAGNNSPQGNQKIVIITA